MIKNFANVRSFDAKKKNRVRNTTLRDNIVVMRIFKALLFFYLYSNFLRYLDFSFLFELGEICHDSESAHNFYPISNVSSIL